MRKPGLFQSWQEAVIKLTLAVVFAVCIGSLALWALGLLDEVAAPGKPQW
jgi:hypothetical protein